MAAKQLKVSVVIPFRNDEAEITNTITSLLINNPNIVDEIIIVDDYSDAPLQLESSLTKVIRSSQHYGVGFSFDAGVALSKNENIFLMGADIRFADNNALQIMTECSKANPQHLIGCECKGAEDDVVFKHDGTHYTSGAEILWKMDNTHLSTTNPFHDDNMYRDILQAKWIMSKQEGITDIPCILGATYAVQKSWYQKIKGFEGHRVWGGLEPYISLKSHMAGGGVKQMNDVFTGHKFGRPIGRTRDWWTYYYNKVFMARMLFDDALCGELLKHVKVWKPAIQADKEIKTNWSRYKSLREYYTSIFTKDIRDTICFNTFTT